MKKNIVLGGLAALFISTSIILSGCIIGNAIRAVNVPNTNITLSESNVLNITDLATYLNMTEEQISSIITLEQDSLSKNGSFTGKMFPYFTVNDQKYFYKDEVNEWLKEISNDHRTYN